jgi:acyl-CoA reductase-like NAD-dependent aldehyde dehydrogenase
MLVIKPYETLQEAVDIANGTRYGLGASVFGRDKKHCRWVMERLECGMVCSNGTLPSLALLSYYADRNSASQILAVRLVLPFDLLDLD